MLHPDIKFQPGFPRPQGHRHTILGRNFHLGFSSDSSNLVIRCHFSKIVGTLADLTSLTNSEPAVLVAALACKRDRRHWLEHRGSSLTYVAGGNRQQLRSRYPPA